MAYRFVTAVKEEVEAKGFGLAKGSPDNPRRCSTPSLLGVNRRDMKIEMMDNNGCLIWKGQMDIIPAIGEDVCLIKDGKEVEYEIKGVVHYPQIEWDPSIMIVVGNT